MGTATARPGRTASRYADLWCDRASGFTFVGSPETFPLILSIAIAIQGIAFAGAQSLGLKQLATFGCALTSEAMLPGAFGNPSGAVKWAFKVLT